MVKVLGLTFTALQAVDGVFTRWAVNNGYVEQNPLYAPVAGDWLAIIAFKLLPAALVSLALYRLTKRYPRLRPVAIAGFVAVVAFYLYVLGSNVCQLF